MKTPFKITINDVSLDAEPGQSILQICRKNNIDVPALCYFEGLTNVGACRLCLVELEGSNKLFPACTLIAQPGQKIKTNTERLKKYQRMTLELFFAERNHICAVCVANNNCELQNLASAAGMTHVRFHYFFQDCSVDASHEKFVLDHNRCILCTRCVRVCDEVEGAHNWDVMNRGYSSRVISELYQPWGESTTCTWCGKCIEICPTGALWPKEARTGKLARHAPMVTDLVEKRKPYHE